MILFVSPDATRTGAPLLLLNNLKWIKKNSNYKFIFLFQMGGVLINEYKSLGHVYILNDPKTVKISSRPIQFFILRAWRKVSKIQKNTFLYLFFIELKYNYNIQLIYSNTVINGYILSELKKRLFCKVITHIHEGELLLDVFNKQGQVGYSLSNSDQIIVVSEILKRVLLEKYKVEIDIKVVPGGIDHRYSFHESNKSILIKERIPEESFIIMTCGTISWHKGMDFFIQISRMLSSYKKKHLHFIWIGGNEEDVAFGQLMYDINKLGLSDHVSIITSKMNVLDYINLADIFLMLSRDESFSLVTIEAGLACKPVLCFEGSGGPCEILDFDPRFIIPYADVNKLSERVIALIENNDERKQMGKFTNERVIGNYTIEKTANSLLQVIRSQIN